MYKRQDPGIGRQFGHLSERIVLRGVRAFRGIESPGDAFDESMLNCLLDLDSREAHFFEFRAP